MSLSRFILPAGAIMLCWQFGAGHSAFASTSQYKGPPRGIYESAGPMRSPTDDTVSRTPRVDGQTGVLVRIDWDLCRGDQECLYAAIKRNLDSAQKLDLKVALAVSDGDRIPVAVKRQCETVDFSFRGRPSSMCLPWHANYLREKSRLVAELGKRFDNHPALSYIYFTGACSTNGFEGHCRVNPALYRSYGYTPAKLTDAYTTIMRSYLAAFRATPIVFEVHTLVDDEGTVWRNVWNSVSAERRVGVAAWWCSERLTQNGRETVPVWPIVKEASKQSFAICQTVSNFTARAHEFSDRQLGLDYGSGGMFSSVTGNSLKAFNDTVEWASGSKGHTTRQDHFAGFSVLELWTVDLKNPEFSQGIKAFRPSPRH